MRNLSKPARRVLVVCYGNIYRSAFLAGYLTKHARTLWQVRSTGFHQVAGRPCPDRLLAISQRFGVDLTGHRSSRIEAQDVRSSDLIVIMDRHNWNALQQLGVKSDQIVWAGVLAKGGVEIEDPYEASDESVARTIARLVESGDRLLQSCIGSTPEIR